MTQALLNIGDFVEIVQQAPVAVPLPKVWYLLRLHPNYDLKAERQLHERGISAYVPKEKRIMKSCWNRRVSKTVPMFPGVMFMPDFDADIQKLKKASEGVAGFVKYDGVALRISLKVMAEIRRFEAWRNGTAERKFKVGQQVRVIRGPFNLLEGTVDRLEHRFRIRILIEFLGARSKIDFDEDQVEAV